MKIILIYLFCLLGQLNEEQNLRGTITARDGKPVARAHVFVTLGREETFAGNDGGFSLTVQSAGPLTITIRHPDFKEKLVTIDRIDLPLTITLDSAKRR